MNGKQACMLCICRISERAAKSRTHSCEVTDCIQALVQAKDMLVNHACKVIWQITIAVLTLRS